MCVGRGRKKCVCVENKGIDMGRGSRNKDGRVSMREESMREDRKKGV